MAITAAASTGFLEMEKETDNLNLWLPTDSDYVKNEKWLRENFPPNTRLSSILFLSDNVLEPIVIKKMFQLLQEIQKIKLDDTEGRDSHAKGQFNTHYRTDPGNLTTQGPIWEEICQQYPVTKKCLELSVLQAFKTPDHQYDNERIENLSSLTEVVDAIDTARGNPIFDLFPPYPCSVQVEKPTEPQEQQIGNTTGKIIGAKAMLLNLVAVVDDKDDQWANEEFEKKLIEKVNNFDLPEGTEAFPFTTRSFGDLVGSKVMSDINTFAAGYVLIFIYVLFNLGKLNSVEQRAWLSVAGIAAVLMGLATSFGLAMLMGVFYSSMNRLLLFLMLGIGIDDMFVIIGAFDNLSAAEKKQTLAKKLGQTMKHAFP